MAEVQEIQFPSGFVLRVPDSMTFGEALQRHSAMSITEGLCPNHSTALAPEPMMPHAGGYCPACDAWWQFDTREKIVVWDAAHLRGEPRVPEWWGDPGYRAHV